MILKMLEPNDGKWILFDDVSKVKFHKNMATLLKVTDAYFEWINETSHEKRNQGYQVNLLIDPKINGKKCLAELATVEFEQKDKKMCIIYDIGCPSYILNNEGKTIERF